MRLKPSIIACALAILSGGVSVSFADHHVSKNHDVQKASNVTNGSVTQHASMPKEQDSFLKMIHNIKGINVSDLEVGDFNLQSKFGNSDWQGGKFAKIVLDKDKHIIQGKVDRISIMINMQKINNIVNTNNKNANKNTSVNDKNAVNAMSDLFPMIIKDSVHDHDFVKSDNLWLGTGKFSAKSWQLGNDAVLNTVTYNIFGKQQGDRVSYGLNFNVDQVKSSSASAGPMAVDVYANLDAEALNRFYGVVSKSGMHHVNANATAEKASQQQAKLAFQNLVVSGVVVKINNISLKQGDGSLSINGNINIPKYSGEKVTSQKMLDAVMKKTEASIDIKFSKAMVDNTVNSVIGSYVKTHKSTSEKGEDADKKIQGIHSMVDGFISMGVGEGYLEQKGDNYIANIVYSNGALTVNGKKVELQSKKPNAEHGSITKK
jgi:uncharacterized protein YdgA (DUF945 family)